ncbi:hypothetical protein EES46_04340 [Streptomyces sp. ADI98-10]|nr:hypothetical protein EES46_04340 [Streptomyces sp. ADI98-10]
MGGSYPVAGDGADAAGGPARSTAVDMPGGSLRWTIVARSCRTRQPRRRCRTYGPGAASRWRPRSGRIAWSRPRRTRRCACGRPASGDRSPGSGWTPRPAHRRRRTGPRTHRSGLAAHRRRPPSQGGQRYGRPARRKSGGRPAVRGALYAGLRTALALRRQPGERLRPATAMYASPSASVPMRKQLSPSPRKGASHSVSATGTTWRGRRARVRSRGMPSDGARTPGDAWGSRRGREGRGRKTRTHVPRARV